MSPRPRVSAIVVRYAAESALDGCIASLKGSTLPPDEICVIDNRPYDGFVSALQKRIGGVDVLPQSENIGFAAGCNAGIERTEGELVFILNDDTKVEPTCIEKLVGAFQRYPRLGACQPKVLSEANPRRFEYAGSSGGFLDMFGVPFLRGRIIDEIEEDTGQYDDEREVFWASGAALMIRRSVLKTVGLFDEEFFAHMEEIDLCWRMHLLGYSVMVIPQAVAYHLGGGTLPYSNPLKAYYNYRNNWRMLIKNFSLWPLVVVVPARLALDVGTIFYFLVKRRPGFALALGKALVSVLLSLPSTLRARAWVQSMRRVSESGLHDLIYRRPVLVDYFFWRRRRFAQLVFPRSRLLLERGKQPGCGGDRTRTR